VAAGKTKGALRGASKNGGSARAGPAGPGSGRRLARSFYDQALTEAEAQDLPSAQEMSGLDEEIAVLRLKLRSALEERPEDVRLMLKGIELLVRAVSARFRLSSKDKEDLAESVRGVLRDIGGPVCPEVFGDVA
jgi:hypothetical protein